uniref:Uncharacterized protein n=1 Tax=Acrobeloides nanus TaxID=290746 RepID=A0A914C3N0_9BILA
MLFAEQTGNIEDAAQLQAEIDDLDLRTGEVDRKRTERIQSIAWINQKNRERMKDAFLVQAAQRTTSEIEKVDDPFTRKSGKMKVSAGSANKGKDEAILDANKMHKSASTPNFGMPVKKEVKVEQDLRYAHDVDIEIDLNLPYTTPATNPQAKLEFPESSRTSTQPTTNTKPKKTLTLEDWKRRKGLIQ